MGRMEGLRTDFAPPFGGVAQINHPRLRRPLPLVGLPLQNRPRHFLQRGFRLDQGKLPSPSEQSDSQLYQSKG